MTARLPEIGVTLGVSHERIEALKHPTNVKLFVFFEGIVWQGHWAECELLFFCTVMKPNAEGATSRVWRDATSKLVRDVTSSDQLVSIVLSNVLVMEYRMYDLRYLYCRRRSYWKLHPLRGFNAFSL